MAEQTFRSPGFFEREVDLTQRTREIEGVPAGVIGTAEKGPAFVPFTVGSFIDFERKFGELDADTFIFTWCVYSISWPYDCCICKKSRSKVLGFEGYHLSSQYFRQPHLIDL